LILDYGSDLRFPIAQGTLPLQQILASKLAKSAYLPLFVALAFGNRLQYRHLVAYNDYERISKQELWWDL